MLGRHESREAAFKALFALNANPDADLDAVFQDVLGEDQEPTAYMKLLVAGVREHQAELDQTITSKLKAGWRIERLTKPDLILLRLGLFEIQFEDLDDKIAVDEVLQLAKKYNDDASAKFINGILGHFVKN